MTSLLASLRVLALAGCGLAALPASAALVTLSGPASVAPGSTFQIDVVGSGLSDVYAFQFDISYKPTLFKAAGVTEGGLLPAAGSTFFDGGLIDNVGGTITMVFDSLVGAVPGANGSGVLARLNFAATGPRNSSGAFQIDNLQLLDSSLNQIRSDVRGLTVSIPEPSTLALVLAAAGFACWPARRAGQRPPCAAPAAA